jgi:hypothetical protein
MFVESVLVANVIWLGEFALKGVNEERADGVEGVKGDGVPGLVRVSLSEKSDATEGVGIVNSISDQSEESRNQTTAFGGFDEVQALIGMQATCGAV